jgi:hypothetical protein
MRTSSGVIVGIAAAALMFFHVGVASAQIDLSGNWVSASAEDEQQGGAGPFFVEYMGIPLTDDGRAAGVSFTTETTAELQRQCAPWPVHYLMHGPFALRIDPITTTDTDAAQIGWRISPWIDLEPVMIWLDGRSGPSTQARKTSSGFTIGKWEGDTLMTTTTHIKDGYLTRSGLPNSHLETLTMAISRHGDLLTVTVMIQDPVNLTAPYVMARTWRYSTAPPRVRPSLCSPAEELSNLKDGHVPSYLTPNENPNLFFMSKYYNIPHEAALGGEQTMFPEYTEKLREKYTVPPAKCSQHCCGSTAPNDLFYNVQVLKCNLSGD